MIRRNPLVSPALAFLLLGTSVVEAHSQSGRKGVENAAKRMINAANRVSIDGLFAEFAPDAEFLDNGGRHASMAAVRTAYTPVFKGLRKQDIKVERSNIQMITPTLAVYTANGTFTTTDTTGATAPRRAFAWTIIWRGDSTNWKATSIHQSIATIAPTVMQAGRSADQSAVFRDHVKAYENAVNKRDGTAIAALFTENGDQILVSGPRQQGRKAIREAADKDLKAWPTARQFRLQVTGSRMLSPDIALVETAATFSEGPVRANRGTMVMVRESGRWLISSLRVFPSVAAPASR